MTSRYIFIVYEFRVRMLNGKLNKVETSFVKLKFSVFATKLMLNIISIQFKCSLLFIMYYDY